MQILVHLLRVTPLGFNLNLDRPYYTHSTQFVLNVGSTLSDIVVRGLRAPPALISLQLRGTETTHYNA